MTHLYSLPCAVALSVSLATGAAGPARSEMVDQVFQAALLPGWQMEPGRQMAGLRLDLAPGWKTYWRSPGEAGIPPSFDWTGSENVKSVQVHWPAPMMFETNGMQSIGYDDQIVLPLEVTALIPGAPVSLRLRLDLGVCKDICIPASTSLSADLLTPGASDETINAALRAVATPGDGIRIDCSLTPVADGMRLTARIALPRLGSIETVVFEPGMAGVWVAQSETSREGGLLTSVTEMVPPSGKPFALDSAGVTVTVLADGRGVEIKGCPTP
ncbi:MAG: protein-disulfide reductase DsbD domain-containing protein [Pseudomonadota bacterium]